MLDQVLEEEAHSPMDIPPEEILVTVAHPFGDIETILTAWMARGPGPRPFVRAINPRRKATGDPLPEEVIPLAY